MLERRSAVALARRSRMRAVWAELLALCIVFGSTFGPLPNVSWAFAQSARAAVHLDGLSGYVDVPGDASVAGASALSIEAWIRPGVLPVDFIPIVARPGYQLGIRHAGTGFMAVVRAN